MSLFCRFQIKKVTFETVSQAAHAEYCVQVTHTVSQTCSTCFKVTQGETNMSNNREHSSNEPQNIRMPARSNQQSQKGTCERVPNVCFDGLTFHLPSILFAPRGRRGAANKMEGKRKVSLCLVTPPQAAVLLNEISILPNVRLTVLNYGPMW